MEFTPFLTFCGGISSVPGIICGPIWRSFVGRDHLMACTNASLAGDFWRPPSEKCSGLKFSLAKNRFVVTAECMKRQDGAEQEFSKQLVSLTLELNRNELYDLV